ncbi:hypothetical protein SAMN06265347_10468 [Halobellus salinus]|nr:hypothetical protein SAMN06265347_10468 [Halobellus salinus]
MLFVVGLVVSLVERVSDALIEDFLRILRPVWTFWT